MIPMQSFPGPSPESERALDRQRAASMADEGGTAGALRDMLEEQAGCADEAPAPEPPLPQGRPRPRGVWAALAYGTAVAAAKLMARVRRAAGRRAAARTQS